MPLLKASKYALSSRISARSRQLLGRMYLLAAILGLEVVVLASIHHNGSLLGPLAPFGIVSFAAFVGLGYSTLKVQRDNLRFSVGYLATNIVCILVVCLGNILALHGYAFFLFPNVGHFLLGALTIAAIGLLAAACIPVSAWVNTFRITGRLWLYAALAGALAWCLRYPFQSFWDDTSSPVGRVLQVMTFHSVKAVLRIFLPNIIYDPSKFTIGTARFYVIIAEGCSGMEGLGLVLVFTIIWLWYFRRESRFPQAILLVPAALTCVYMLNIARISSLVLIGNAGAPDVAMVGFHSQAGWIAFTTVAFCFSMATRKLRWVRRIPSYSVPVASSSNAVHGSPTTPEIVASEEDETGESPATGAFLVPFLAILGASFISKAGSAYFEWLYPLRFIAAVIAIWYFRATLFGRESKLNWRFGWLAPVIGTAIFLIWIAPSLLSHHLTASPLGYALSGLPPAAAWTWITFRVLAAAITVPIAEELCFRGYLARRLIDRDFETIPFTALTVLSIGLSSVAFGLMHGHQWIVGTLAGLAFALAIRWRGRIGDAVIAHATSNILLAAWVLLRGDWGQW